ncbi:MAG: sigma-70 family RNA polymerase sigma factor [Xanthomonadales bacterium]|nr:sigma-70 family RNA polymerase sigma factor [Xanthomonadales bacterium]
MLTMTAPGSEAGEDLATAAQDDPASERSLVAAAADGDQRAFECLYRTHVGRVHAVVWRLAGGIEARAEEITQEAFIRAWRALPGFRADAAFSTWLHRLAVNTALMALRSRNPANESGGHEDDLLHLDDGSSCRGVALDLESAVARLPERARAVLVLHDVEGWKHEEIAQQLDMAVGTSKAQLHRARGLLRAWLEGEKT